MWPASTSVRIMLLPPTPSKEQPHVCGQGRYTRRRARPDASILLATTCSLLVDFSSSSLLVGIPWCALGPFGASWAAPVATTSATQSSSLEPWAEGGRRPMMGAGDSNDKFSSSSSSLLLFCMLLFSTPV